MNLLEVKAMLNPEAAKKTNRSFAAAKKCAGRFMKFKAQLIEMSPTSAKIYIEAQHWLPSESIVDAFKEINDAIVASDTQGHLASVVEDGSGEHFLEAVLSSLRPGQPVIAEAFFPTFIFEITWKNIVSKGNK